MRRSLFGPVRPEGRLADALGTIRLGRGFRTRWGETRRGVQMSKIRRVEEKESARCSFIFWSEAIWLWTRLELLPLPPNSPSPLSLPSFPPTPLSLSSSACPFPLLRLTGRNQVSCGVRSFLALLPPSASPHALHDTSLSLQPTYSPPLPKHPSTNTDQPLLPLLSLQARWS